MSWFLQEATSDGDKWPNEGAGVNSGRKLVILLKSGVSLWDTLRLFVGEHSPSCFFKQLYREIVASEAKKYVRSLFIVLGFIV